MTTIYRTREQESQDLTFADTLMPNTVIENLEELKPAMMDATTGDNMLKGCGS